ncbi:choice-of-anchor J domain-containing protein [Flavobacteriales bacterium]|nr:choice-of-anchor J domain-containing protein [Flavobacteriales bacterium]
MKTTTAFILLICSFFYSYTQTYFTEDFEPVGGTLNQNNAWTTQIVTAHPNGYDWFHSDFNGSSFAKISNYDNATSSNDPLESWLISPLIDLSTATNPNLIFNHTKRYNGANLAVLISTDYLNGAPSSATWTDLTSLFSMDTDVNSWTFVSSGNLDLSSYISSSSSTITIAFQYFGGASDGSTYEVDDIIINEGATTPNVISIYDIQYSTAIPADSPFSGQQLNTGGIVNFVRYDKSFYLSSGTGPWSGIYVFDTLNVVSVGDSITFSCQVDEFYELSELKNLSNLVIVSSGNNFSSNFVSSDAANSEAYEGCLVTVNSAICTNPNAGFGNWIINDGSGPATVDDFFFPFTPIANQVYDVSGLVDYSFGEFKILPRDIDDIDAVTAIINNETISFSIYPNPTTNFITIELNQNSKINIIDAIGKNCFTETMSRGVNTINISNLPKGNYFIKIGTQAKKLIIK